ncbi:tyrosine-type recombinase/integrase [Paludisphaera mucosa]|uniref:Site-specific integrase n=1 Tax=Paludisphaera mucosa TaxID=3030827 RepID=A0ABT6FEB3_9BACT|nr:site-specific integrase [Paludisphaera mucosa]MDG3005831.1 site-specific integrase [Paludisphaera mucosa]
MTTDNPPGSGSEPVGNLVRIFLRGRTWWANYQHAGRQNRKSLGTTNKKEARRRALLLEAELLQGRHRDRPEPPTVDEAVSAYLDHLRAERRSAKTMVKYEYVLGRLAGLLRDRRAGSLLDLDLKAMDAYRKSRVQAGAAPKTVYTETVIARQLVKFALSRGMITEDPLRGLRLGKPKPSSQPCWSNEEVERILASAGAAYRDAYVVLADTGMRAGELVHLCWEDVDFARNVIHIRPKPGWTPKTGDRRAIPMSPRARATLEAMPRRGEWAFTAPSISGRPAEIRQMSDRRLLAALKRVLARLGLPGHLHTFRHAFISRALTGGIAESVVREWVGHVDRDVMKLYTHIASATSQEAMRKLSQSGRGPSDPAPG